MKKGPCVNWLRSCIAQSGRALRSGAVGWAYLSVASSGEGKVDWGSLRWRVSFRAVRRPGGRWRLWERRVCSRLSMCQIALGWRSVTRVPVEGRCELRKEPSYEASWTRRVVGAAQRAGRAVGWWV
jgi:hypothetical protein